MSTEATSANASQREALSALLDDEAQELELRRLLRGLDRDDGEARELRQHWYRLNVARTAMHGERCFDAPDFASRVAAAIAEDDTPAVTGTQGWRRAVGSFAVAASVAAVVVVGGQRLTVDGDAARVAPLPVGVVNTTGAVPVQASFGTRDVPTLQPADHTAYRELARQRLRKYCHQHAEHASLNTPQGMLSFARFPIIEQ